MALNNVSVNVVVGVKRHTLHCISKDHHTSVDSFVSLIDDTLRIADDFVV